MLKGLYHNHTCLCDGHDAPREMAQAAYDAGLGHFGFSGHMDHDIHMDWDEYVAQVKGVADEWRGRMDVLLGVELDTLYGPGRACCPGAQYVIGSTHFVSANDGRGPSVDNEPELFEQLCRDCYGGDWMALTRDYYQVEATVVERTGCDFIGHFDLVAKFNGAGASPLGKYFDESSREYLEPALETMELLVEQGKPFEVNSGAIARGYREVCYPRPELLRALRRMGGQIILSTDAHSTQGVLGGLDVAVKQAIDCGFTHALYLASDGKGGVRFEEQPLDEAMGEKDVR
ncbi:MAG: PHP domain-containing protein [Tractidigestivibacter sp.]|jgi:histidinol-phosphatase (PHP family)|uniref:PHP domain-containing protein n=1 Tax=Tractidigestivibacter sp. TaxID=2847320 RepID=UPI003D913CBA